MTEREALRSLKRGEQRALDWFIDRYMPYVTTIIYNVIGRYMTKGDIEETASDVFFALWQNARKVRPGSEKAYLGTVARNMAKNKLRKFGYELSLEDPVLLVDGVTPESVCEEKELHCAVRRGVLNMGEPEREIFLRHYYYHQKTQQIAEEMGINHATVRSKLRRGRESLKNTLETYFT